MSFQATRTEPGVLGAVSGLLARHFFAEQVGRDKAAAFGGKDGQTDAMVMVVFMATGTGQLRFCASAVEQP
jgi:hypothetical protein